jgi:hypothetical protein
MGEATTGPLKAIGVERLAAADTQSALARLADSPSPLMAEGKVVVIALDAIRDRLGPRWEGRSQQVHDHVQRTLSRHLRIGSWFAPISDVDYVVVQPALTRYAAQASCLSYMRDLLEHFLGRFVMSDCRIREATGLEPGRIQVRELDPQSVVDAAREEVRRATPPRPSDEAEAARADNPFTAASGELLRVSLRLDPLFSLSDFVQVGYRLNRQVIDEHSGEALSHEALSRLTTSDLEKIDLATIARGLSRLKSERAKAREPSLVLPVAFPTLASQKARRALIACLKGARETIPVRVTCEISRLEGVPPNALYSAVGMMKPFCDGVIGGVEKPRRSAAGLRGSGLAGLAFAYTGPSSEDADRMIAALGPDLEAAAAVSNRVLLLGLRSARELSLAAILGASHATLRGGGRPTAA